MASKTMDNVLDDLIKRLSRPAIRSQAVLGRLAEVQVFAGYEPPALFHTSINPDRPQVVAELGDHQIRVDPMLKFPKLVVSKKFRDTFDSKMADDLQTWMSERFGYDYPVYVENKTILMHPEAFLRLKQKLGAYA